MKSSRKSVAASDLGTAVSKESIKIKKMAATRGCSRNFSRCNEKFGKDSALQLEIILLQGQFSRLLLITAFLDSSKNFLCYSTETWDCQYRGAKTRTKWGNIAGYGELKVENRVGEAKTRGKTIENPQFMLVY